MSTSPVTFVSLAAEIQQRFGTAAAEVSVIDRLQLTQFAASGAFAAWPLGALLRALHKSLAALDVGQPGSVFVNHFDVASRAWEPVLSTTAQIAPYAEQSSTPLRRLALDLGLHTGAIGNVGKDLEPLLQMLGQLLTDRDKMLKHAEAQAHVRTLYGQAAEFANRARMLQEISNSGRAVRSALTALIDSQKAVLATLQGPLPEAWPHWHTLVSHFVGVMGERPSNARHHPAIPEMHKRLVSLVTRAINEAEEAEALRQKAREQLLTLQKQLNMCKGWSPGVSAPSPSAPHS